VSLLVVYNDGMTRIRMIPAIALASVLAAACHDSDPKLRTDTSTDPSADVHVDPTVPACDDLLEWSLVVSTVTSAAGQVTGQVELESAGTIPTCAGPPCLVVSVLAGTGGVENVTHESATRARFTYVDEDMGPGETGQLMLRWRVLCTDAGGQEERVVTTNTNVCADASSNLSLSAEPCP
jgi:hypothetical protein